MKKFYFVCLLSVLFVHLNADENPKLAYSSIKFCNQSLDSALYQLEKVSEYRFLYEDKISTDAIIINQKFEWKTTPQILDVLLSKSGYNYFCFSSEHFARAYIVIYRKTMEPPKENTFSSITGTVIDENGEPVMYASVYVSEDNDTFIGRDIKAVTNENGSFVIPAVPSNAYIIVFYPAYLPRVVPVKDSEIIKLEPDSVAVNEVLIIGAATL